MGNQISCFSEYWDQRSWRKVAFPHSTTLLLRCLKVPFPFPNHQQVWALNRSRKMLVQQFQLELTKTMAKDSQQAARWQIPTILLIWSKIVYIINLKYLSSQFNRKLHWKAKNRQINQDTDYLSMTYPYASPEKVEEDKTGNGHELFREQANWMDSLTTVSEVEESFSAASCTYWESAFSEEHLYFSKEVQQRKLSFTFHHSCITIGARKKGLTSLGAKSCNKYTTAHRIITYTHNHVAIRKHH